MTGLRRLLSPGWALGLVLVFAFAALCFALLAPWQLGKSDRLDDRNRQLTESVSADPIPYGPTLVAPEDAFSRSEWHRVTVRGEYLPGSEVLLRLRSVDGDLVYQVLSVFRPDSGSPVLVNRGHIPVGENNTVPEHPPVPGGNVTLTARLRVAETGPADPVELGGHRAVRSIDPGVISPLVGQSLETRGYLQLVGDQPGSLSTLPVPAVESGPYLSYGLQWIAFGVLAPFGLAYFAWAEISARRREAAVRAVAHAGDTRVGAGSRPSPSRSSGSSRDGCGPTSSPRDPGPTLNDRYGSRFDAEHQRARRRRNRLADE